MRRGLTWLVAVPLLLVRLPGGARPGVPASSIPARRVRVHVLAVDRSRLSRPAAARARRRARGRARRARSSAVLDASRGAPRALPPWAFGLLAPARLRVPGVPELLAALGHVRLARRRRPDVPAGPRRAAPVRAPRLASPRACSCARRVRAGRALASHAASSRPSRSLSSRSARRPPRARVLAAARRTRAASSRRRANAGRSRRPRSDPDHFDEGERHDVADSHHRVRARRAGAARRRSGGMRPTPT